MSLLLSIPNLSTNYMTCAMFKSTPVRRVRGPAAQPARSLLSSEPLRTEREPQRHPQQPENSDRPEHDLPPAADRAHEQHVAAA